MLQQLKLLLTALSGLMLIQRDALGDKVGSSIPLVSEQFATSKHLSQFIRDHALLPVSSSADICAVNRLDIHPISSNCNNLVIELQQTADSRLPSSLFIKLPSHSFITRWFFNVIGSWRLETFFFTHTAKHIPVRTPITYAASAQGSRFALVQENLYADPLVKLFTNLDMLKGPSIDLVRRCLDTFAKIHASTYHTAPQDRDALLPMSQHILLAPATRTISQMLNKQALAPCIKKQPGVISEPLIAAYRKSIANWDTLLDNWFAGPLSIIHGDSHLGNFFINGNEMGMLDWQAVHWGKGIRDVQYFLIDSVPANILAEHEQALVHYYIERLGYYDVEMSFDQAWTDYRGLSFHTLMTIVVSIGFGAMNKEQDALMAEILKRAVAAAERVDYSGWLEALLNGRHA